MKIRKTLLEQIIKEEAEKINRILILKEEKINVIKQLSEMYTEAGTLDEGVMKDLWQVLSRGLMGNRTDKEIMNVIKKDSKLTDMWNQLTDEQKPKLMKALMDSGVSAVKQTEKGEFEPAKNLGMFHTKGKIGASHGQY